MNKFEHVTSDDHQVGSPGLMSAGVGDTLPCDLSHDRQMPVKTLPSYNFIIFIILQTFTEIKARTPADSTNIHKKELEQLIIQTFIEIEARTSHGNHQFLCSSYINNSDRMFIYSLMKFPSASIQIS